jgi:hypothetical protein
MNTRKDFLSRTVKGSAAAVATALLPRTASAANASDMNGSNSMEQTISRDNKDHYKPPFRLRTDSIRLERPGVTQDQIHEAVQADESEIETTVARSRRI